MLAVVGYGMRQWRLGEAVRERVLENLPRKTACNDTQVNAMTSATTHSVNVSLSFFRSICRSLSRSSSAANTESYKP